MRRLAVSMMAMMLAPALAVAEPRSDAAQAQDGPDPARAEKRMRLARTLGLAEALDLDTPAALQLGEQLARFDERRRAARKQAADAHDVLRAAARGGKATAAEVDGAIAKLLEARNQMQALDREMLQTVTRDLSPEKKARAALFLGTFRDRIERKAMRHHGRGPGHGMGAGGGPRWNMRGPRQGMPPGGDDEDLPPFGDDI
ncbi:MAG TPA: hypothetical protein VEB43_19560 [Anaeromyxobacter sp.]|nr:hypothetical protein [Anaeromyxobacter sp.]